MNSVKSIIKESDELKVRLKSLTACCEKLRTYIEITSALLEPVRTASIEGDIDARKLCYGLERAFSLCADDLSLLAYDADSLVTEDCDEDFICSL